MVSGPFLVRARFRMAPELKTNREPKLPLRPLLASRLERSPCLRCDGDSRCRVPVTPTGNACWLSHVDRSPRLVDGSSLSRRGCAVPLADSTTTPFGRFTWSLRVPKRARVSRAVSLSCVFASAPTRPGGAQTGSTRNLSLRRLPRRMTDPIARHVPRSRDAKSSMVSTAVIPDRLQAMPAAEENTALFAMTICDQWRLQ